jgi:MFS family permease
MGNVSAPGPTAGAPADARRPWQPTPFTRLARSHALSVAGDTLFTAAMAGTVFFSVGDFDEARSRVALLLVFTLAPFAVAAPLLGPLLDRARGGRRWMLVGIAIARAVLCLLILRDRDSLWFYAEALGFLVLSKGYLITRGAIVPTTVHNDAELVKANSRLALLSGVVAVLAAIPAGLFLALNRPSWLLVPAAALFLGCAALATKLPPARVAPAPADAVERAELRSVGILVAASSMAVLRLIVGFFVFQVGFYAKDNGQAALMVVAAVAAQAGFLIGSMTSPVLRRTFSEERILAIMLAAAVAAGVLASLLGVLAGGSAITLGLAASLLSFAIGASSNIGKQAFDAIVQRDAPDANRGRSFARFETRFQLVWVLGALVPTAVVLPMEVAFVVISAAASFALLSYLVGRQRVALGRDHRLVRLPRPVEVASRMRQRRQPDEVEPDEKSVVAAPIGGLQVPDIADDPAITRHASDELPRMPSLPPAAAASGGGLFGDNGTLDADHRAETPLDGTIFTPDTPLQAPPTLDPRRVLDPGVAFEDTGVRPPTYLGFLDDGQSEDTTLRPAPRGRRRRRGRALPGRTPLRRRARTNDPGPTLFDE